MADILFIVTIPTEAEENHQKQEFIAQKYNIKPKKEPNHTNTDPPKKVDKVLASAETLLGDNTTPPPTPLPTPIADHRSPNPQTLSLNLDNVSNTNDTNNNSSISINAIDENTPSSRTADNVTGNLEDGRNTVQFATLPKRKKSEQNTVNITTNALSDADKSEKLSKIKKKAVLADTDLTHDTCMELVLRALLRKYKIENDVWTKGEENRKYQVFFTVEFNETYEKMLDDFNEWGIGDRDGSTVSVLNCLASKTFAHNEEHDKKGLNSDFEQKQGAWDRFMNSVRSRLNVSQVVENVRRDASITFDFLVLLTSAAILAAFGLIENSTVFLAASMLISPLMGPIIATIFGTVIKDPPLIRLGLKNELIGILTAIGVGFIFGIIMCITDHRYGIGEGLTNEMLSRCELRSLIVGVFTAIPSGAAASVGILGGNIGSLVGVAISASLLPPAVNAGLLWSIALIYKIYENDDSRFTNVVKSTHYSDNQANELAVLGSISMCLTISNIICIYFMGILVLKVKEIAPKISKRSREFWKHDVKVARGLKRYRFNSDSAILDEFSHLPKADQKALGLNSDILRSMHLDNPNYQNTWSPLGARLENETAYDPLQGNYSTVHQLDRLYATITSQSPRNRFGLGRRHGGRFTTSCETLFENPTKTKTSPPNYMADEHKRRKFVVTPADDDPLQSLCHSDDVKL